MSMISRPRSKSATRANAPVTATPAANPPVWMPPMRCGLVGLLMSITSRPESPATRNACVPATASFDAEPLSPVAASPPRRRGIADVKNLEPGFPRREISKVTGDRDIGCRPASRRPTEAPRRRRIADIKHRESAAVGRDECVRPAHHHRIRRPTFIPRPHPADHRIEIAANPRRDTQRQQHPANREAGCQSKNGGQRVHPMRFANTASAEPRDESKARVSQFRHTSAPTCVQNHIRISA